MLILNEQNIKYGCSMDQYFFSKFIIHQNISNIVIKLSYLITNKIKVVILEGSE